ncbi:MAG: MFS transporter [Anaerolineae bacterium]|nr:MFS transporter [Anaerolineae bacterium]
MSKAQGASTAAGERPDDRKAKSAILIAAAGGHGLSHFIYQGFLVALPTVKDALGIGPVGVGAIMTARELASGFAALPGGVICDRLQRYWGLILAACMAGFGLGWLVVSLSPSYLALIAGMVLLSVSSSLWHLPAMAALSQRFSDRRGAALSIHGVGGAVGDVVGPVLTGVLLGTLTWRGVISAYAVGPLLLVPVVARVFRDTSWLRGSEQARSDLRTQVRATRELLKDALVWRINLVSCLRGMCYQAYTTFLPLFLAEEVGFDSRGVGFHLGLLFSVGIVASPVMGHLSDRVGRKAVLVPTLIGLCVLSVLLALYGQGLALTAIILLLGLFIRSDYSLLSAMVLDVVGEGVATTTLGIMSFARFVVGAVSPLIAGVLYERTGMRAVLYYAAGIYALAAVLLLTTRLRRAGVPDGVPAMDGGR